MDEAILNSKLQNILDKQIKSKKVFNAVLTVQSADKAVDWAGKSPPNPAMALIVSTLTKGNRIALALIMKNGNSHANTSVLLNMLSKGKLQLTAALPMPNL